MKHYHYAAQIFTPEMALMQVQSGIITSPNTSPPGETMAFLNNDVLRPAYPEPLILHIQAFVKVEQDDDEPGKPLTQEDIDQHRHDDKLEAAYHAAGMLSDPHGDLSEALDLHRRWSATPPPVLSTDVQVKPHQDLMEAIERINADPANATQIVDPATDPKPGFRKPDCVCWYCGMPHNSLDLADNDFECPRCETMLERNLTPCINCQRIITKPGGVHYCNMEVRTILTKEDSSDTASVKLVKCSRCNQMVNPNGVHLCIHGRTLPRL